MDTPPSPFLGEVLTLRKEAFLVELSGGLRN